MSNEYCTIVYDGSKATAAHLKNSFVLKGVRFDTGKPVEVHAELAGLAEKAFPPGTLKIKAGTPKAPTATVGATAKTAMRQDAAFRAEFPVDPARALDGIAELSKETRKLLEAKDAADQVAAGKADAELPSVALVAKLLGLEDVATAAVRRVEALRPKA